MTVTLITSASYVADELAAEFGALPPSFLPVGHNRLYDLQAAILGEGAHLTLPASFDLPAADAERLAALGVARGAKQRLLLAVGEGDGRHDCTLPRVARGVVPEKELRLITLGSMRIIQGVVHIVLQSHPGELPLACLRQQPVQRQRRRLQ